MARSATTNIFLWLLVLVGVGFSLYRAMSGGASAEEMEGLIQENAALLTQVEDLEAQVAELQTELDTAKAALAEAEPSPVREEEPELAGTPPARGTPLNEETDLVADVRAEMDDRQRQAEQQENASLEAATQMEQGTAPPAAATATAAEAAPSISAPPDPNAPVVLKPVEPPATEGGAAEQVEVAPSPFAASLITTLGESMKLRNLSYAGGETMKFQIEEKSYEISLNDVKKIRRIGKPDERLGTMPVILQLRDDRELRATLTVAEFTGTDAQSGEGKTLPVSEISEMLVVRLQQ